MTAVRLIVETADLDDAAAMLARVGDTLDRLVGSSLEDVRGVCAGMAGDDPVGARWSASYDATAGPAAQAAADAINGCYRLAAVVSATARNYAGADAASNPHLGAAGGLLDGGPLQPPPVASVVTSFPAAGGDPLPWPMGWDKVERWVRRVWPNGHQDRLRAAAAGWQESANALVEHAFDVDMASICALRDDLPEADDIHTVCQAMTARLEQLAHAHRRLEHACLELADLLDTVHHEIEHELLGLAAQVVLTEVAGALLTAATAAASDVVAQGIAGQRIVAAAARIAELIDGFAAAAAVVVDALPAVSDLVAGVRAGLDDVLSIRVVTADLTGVGELPTIGLTFMGRATNGGRDWRRIEQEARAIENLTTTDQVYARARAAAETVEDGDWRDPSTLLPHFNAHGDDVGASSPRDYAFKATAFFRNAFRRPFLIKIADDDAVRIYDPATNTFGSFDESGACRTLFKPDDGSRYWNEQPGRLIR